MQPTLRLFFAIELDDNVRQQLTALIQTLRITAWGCKIRWVRSENLHLTLRFIGHCLPERQKDLLQHVSNAIQPITPFTLELGAVHFFPSHDKPHVIVTTIHAHPMLYKLAHAVETSAVNAGFPPEKRPYLPHISLGRITHAMPIEHIALPPLATTSFAVSKITLLHSELDDHKHRLYTPLTHLHL